MEIMRITREEAIESLEDGIDWKDMTNTCIEDVLSRVTGDKVIIISKEE